MRILLLLAALFASPAWAGYQGMHDSGDSATGYVHPSALAACQAAAGRLMEKYPSITVAGVAAEGLGGNGVCKGTLNGGALSNIGWWYYDGVAIPEPPKCTKGKVSTQTYFDGITRYLDDPGDPAQDGPRPANVGECAAVPKKLLRCFSDPSKPYPRSAYCTWEMEMTGAAAPPDGPGPATDAPDPSNSTPESLDPKSAGQGKSCPAGTVNMGIDSAGGAMCGGTGTSPNRAPTETKTTPTTTTTNADGSTTTTSSTGVKNSDGSTTTTTTTTTTGTDGTKTTSTKTDTGPATGGGAGSSDGKEKNDLCAARPELTICKNSTVSGSCEAVSCSGDAIQCSILRSTEKANCAAKADSDALKESDSFKLGTAVLAGNDPNKAANAEALKGTEIDLAGNTLDQQGFISGACFPNKTIRIMNRNVAVNFSSVCSSIEPLKYAVLACSLIAAYLLLSKSVLQG